MAGGGKKGNVVLIEAFVVLCLLFMLQYVVAGIGNINQSEAAPDMFVIDVGAVETSNNATSHIDFVQVGQFMIDMGAGHLASANCPTPLIDPRAYPVMQGTGLPNAPPAPLRMNIAGVDKVNSVSINDAQAFSALRDELTLSQHLTLYTYPGQVGQNLVISGFLSDLKGGLFLSVFLCRCLLGTAPGTTIGLEHPHPVILTLTTIRPKETNVQQFIAYYHQEQMSDRNLEGLLFDNSTKATPLNPIRRFDIFFSADGTTRHVNFTAQPVSTAAKKS